MKELPKRYFAIGDGTVSIKNHGKLTHFAMHTFTGYRIREALRAASWKMNNNYNGQCYYCKPEDVTTKTVKLYADW